MYVQSSALVVDGVAGTSDVIVEGAFVVVAVAFVVTDDVDVMAGMPQGLLLRGRGQALLVVGTLELCGGS